MRWGEAVAARESPRIASASESAGVSMRMHLQLGDGLTLPPGEWVTRTTVEQRRHKSIDETGDG